jgi:tRNA(Ile)-lysidine synthase
MINLITKLPRQLTVACSGGVDSMAVLNFLMNSHKVSVAFFHHGTQTSDQAASFVKSYCQAHDVKFTSQQINQVTTPKGLSQEEHWRTERYKFLHAIDDVVITAHHLDDCVETYLFNCVHGKSHTIPFRNRNVIRPFLTTTKKELVNWCERKAVPWQEDASNQDLKYMRNLIRHQIVPQALKINPGLHTVVKKMVLDSLDK